MRVANYGAFLRQHGLELDFRPTLSPEEYRVVSSGARAARKMATLAASAARAAGDHPSHDLVLIHRVRCLHPLPGLDPPLRLDAYDFDDALFLSSSGDGSRWPHWVKQEARRCTACLRRARLVIAGNEFLAAHARAHSPRVEVVPSCIDPDRQPIHHHDQTDLTTIGWIGSQTTTSYLDPVLPVLAALNRDRAVAKLIVIGGDTGVREAWIEHRAWALETEPDVIASFDIGLMPLPDTEWARGKCGYKALQYFSAGVPAVVSPVGVASRLVGDSRGLIATTPEEWRAALTRLIDDVDERRERGAAAREFAEREYSYQRWAPELAALLRSLAA